MVFDSIKHKIIMVVVLINKFQSRSFFRFLAQSFFANLQSFFCANLYTEVENYILMQGHRIGNYPGCDHLAGSVFHRKPIARKTHKCSIKFTLMNSQKVSGVVSLQKLNRFIDTSLVNMDRVRDYLD